jgi:hypothetical protein
LRSILIAAAAALVFASAADAKQFAQGPYTRDAHHKCRASNGAQVPSRLCVQHHPVCDRNTSKPCGNTCIAKDKECHA